MSDVGTTKRKPMSPTRRGSVPIDHTGSKFGMWTVLRLCPERRSRRTLWQCKCECGTEKAVLTCHLTSGKSTRCQGCKPRGEASKSFKHGGKSHPLYSTWLNMLSRCGNPNNKNWDRYGGRGIRVCDEWRVDFLAFVRDMGPKPSKLHSVDRIDRNGNYTKENTRWATPKTQARNMSRNRHVDFDGQRMTLAEACERSGINYAAARWRLNNGYNWAGL